MKVFMMDRCDPRRRITQSAFTARHGRSRDLRMTLPQIRSVRPVPGVESMHVFDFAGPRQLWELGFEWPIDRLNKTILVTKFTERSSDGDWRSSTSEPRDESTPLMQAAR
jgi:hypothetical protein